MANIIITEDLAVAVEYSQRTISGTVFDAAGNPVKREIVAIIPGRDLVMARTFSDKTTGVFTLSLNAGPGDQITVVFFGIDGENSKAVGHIIGDLA